jgi:chemotaxis protein MotB
MTLEYRQNILKKYFEKNLFADIGIRYNQYGSAGSDPAVDLYFAWDVTYIGINLGLDYAFYRPGRFIFYAKATASPEFLIHGTQRLNDQVYNLVGEDDFNSPIYFFRGGLGVQYQLTDQAMVYIQYMGGKSFNFNNDSEKLNIVANNFGFGLLIKLSKGKYKTGRIDPVSEQRMIDMENKIDAYSEKIDELEVQAERAEELEQQIIVKDVEMKGLKETISSSLFYFDGKGLHVNQRQGKVYVTMDNDMLFESGSWVVGEEGVKAVEALGRGLAQNPEISILIEGHTDNQPYIGKGNIKNNWDLSIKRATAIVEILRKNPDIDSSNLTAAGRGEHAPIASNDTIEGRAKNRRIEIIITPNLEEVSKFLK